MYGVKHNQKTRDAPDSSTRDNPPFRMNMGNYITMNWSGKQEAVRNIILIVFFISIACCLAYIILHIIFSPKINLSNLIHQFSLQSNTITYKLFFIGSMILLPPVGFPISIFLVLVGVQFGVITGIFLTVLILPLHMLICYSIIHTFMRKPLIRFLSRRGWDLPILYSRRPGLAMIGFLLMPGPPYILKTYLLALTGMPFFTFLIVNWLTECLVTIPIVAMSGAAYEQNWYLFAAVLLIFALSIIVRWFKKRQIQAIQKT